MSEVQRVSTAVLGRGVLSLAVVFVVLGALMFLPAALATLTLIVRTILEDRTLQKELEGYKDYTHCVPRRLIPGIW